MSISYTAPFEVEAEHFVWKRRGESFGLLLRLIGKVRNGLWRKSSEGEMVFIELARRFIVHFMIFEFSFLCCAFPVSDVFFCSVYRNRIFG